MKVVLDNNALIYLLNPKAKPLTRARLRGLTEQVEQARGVIYVPAPVLTEFLCHAAELALRQQLLQSFRTSRWVVVAPFDEMAAVECSQLEVLAIASGNKRAPLPSDTPWQAVKVDRQIVAIAKSRGASIISGDDDVRKVAAWAGVPASRVEDLPIPDSAKQLEIAGLPAPDRGARLQRGVANAVARAAKKEAVLRVAPPKQGEAEDKA